MVLLTKSTRSLDLANNTLTSLSKIKVDAPGGILFENNTLPALAFLEMSANLTELPQQFLTGNLTSLTTLVLDGNQLKEFPDTKLAPQLKNLSLNSNKIGNFSNRNYPLLEALDLGTNPGAIFLDNDLPNLRYLDLYEYELTEFSPSNKVPRLEELLLFSNQLTEFHHSEL